MAYDACMFQEERIKMSARDVAVFVSVIMIVAMLIIPFPTWLLSILIIINISLALLSTINFDEYDRTSAIFNFSYSYYYY